jgi:serine/threonine protein phosphatase PrpC
MEDYHVAKFVQLQDKELGLFAIYDGHLGDRVPAYLQKHLFSNILREVRNNYISLYTSLIKIHIRKVTFLFDFNIAGGILG